ncbi:LytTR family transcriptional regulator DNA-binding domain-containing protein [Paenibacillus sp. y28]|uniref:LytTR family transcriptional regulator DNA-binding domain-containing protein n=1 Tax=Paenibacillus sp. y28 TaxID=3129110 RepID=UPI00301A736B
MKMPVLRRREDKSTELVELDLQEVLYINIEDRNIVYHTRTDKYYQITKLSELDEHLPQLGFDLLDKTNLVNMNEVKSFDPKLGNIYFDEHPDKSSKVASVAFIQQKIRKNQIAQAIARNTGTTLTYSLKDTPGAASSDLNTI